MESIEVTLARNMVERTYLDHGSAVPLAYLDPTVGTNAIYLKCCVCLNQRQQLHYQQDLPRREKFDCINRPTGSVMFFFPSCVCCSFVLLIVSLSNRAVVAEVMPITRPTNGFPASVINDVMRKEWQEHVIHRTVWSVATE